MPRLLHVIASPRGDSVSHASADEFIGALAKHHADLDVDTLDLWSTTLPEFDGHALSAKYATLKGLPRTAEQEQAWRIIAGQVERLDRAAAVLISTPLWNFGIPYKLKHWIDLITQPGLTFRFNPEEGYAPLLRQRPTLVVLASAGDYSAGTSFGRPDLATPYLQSALAFIGLADAQVVPVAPTVGPAERTFAGQQAALARLQQLASSFLRASS